MEAKPTICCFGVTKPSSPRDTILLEGLTLEGYKIIECIDTTPGLKKYWNIARKLSSLKGACDVLFVPYSNIALVPFAQLLSNKKVIFNSLCQFYESEITDRGRYAWYSPKAIWIWFMDFLSYHSADMVLLETNARIEQVSKLFFISPKKCVRTWTSADPTKFFPDASTPKTARFTVVFRGYFLPYNSMETIIEAARLLKDEDIVFHIIGRGYLKTHVKKLVDELASPNVKLDIGFLDESYLLKSLREAHVALGQFSSTDRVQITITHKTYEAVALGLPVITASSKGMKELLVESENCLYVRCEDPRDLADKILVLKNDRALVERMGKNNRELFLNKLSSKVIGKDFDAVLTKFLNK